MEHTKFYLFLQYLHDKLSFLSLWTRLSDLSKHKTEALALPPRQCAPSFLAVPLLLNGWKLHRTLSNAKLLNQRCSHLYIQHSRRNQANASLRSYTIENPRTHTDRYSSMVASNCAWVGRMWAFDRAYYIGCACVSLITISRSREVARN